MKRILLICLSLAVIPIFTGWAQERSVSGNIISLDDGTTIPGVNIVIKGTSNGTVTDFNGDYILNVPAEAEILVYSFIGLTTQEIEIGNRSVIDVQMATDVTQLAEIVITAVGIEREKKALGYAVTNLSSDEIAQKSEMDPVRSLTGKIPGVSIISSSGAAGGATNINIRGKSSLLGLNQPLFVVDGVPFDNTLFETQDFTNGASGYTNRAFDIDPNNIESLTILKGAASSALYGSRAANGVVLITTKSGSKGKGQQKGLEVSYNFGYAIEKVASLVDVQDQFTQGGEFAYDGGLVGSWGARYEDVNAAGGVPHPLDQARLNDAFPEFIGQTILLKPRNNAEEFFETGRVIENSVQISHTGDVVGLTAGASRTHNEGITPNNVVNRTTVNFGGNAQLDNGLFLSGNINYVSTNQVGPQLGTPLSGNTTSVTTRLLFTPPNYDLKNYPFINPLDGSNVYYRTDQDNPYWLTETSPYTSDVDRSFGNINLSYDVFEWLTLSYRFGWNTYTDRRKTLISKGSNVFPLGQLIEHNIWRQELDGTFLATVTRDLNEDLDLTLIIGHNVNQRETNEQQVLGTGQIVFGINDLDNFSNVVPNGGDIEKRRLVGVFADATLGYRGWAFLNLVARNDWSSTLPAAERSFIYPGASLSLIFTDALNLQSNILDFGKIRLGLAKVGNDADPYLTSALFVTNSSFGNDNIQTPFTNANFPNGVNTVTEDNTLGNPTLKPEFTTEFEIGTELEFIDNRIILDFAYYFRKSTDQIVTGQIAPSSGFNLQVFNIGEVTNKGIEIALTVVPISLENGFSWTITNAFTRNVSKVVKLAPGLDQLSDATFGFSDLGIVHRPGLPFGQIRGTDILRADDGLPLINPESGLFISDPELQIIGDPNPDFQWGITNTFEYKGITLSGLLDWVQGGDLYSDVTASVRGRGISTETVNLTGGREATRIIPGWLGDPVTGEVLLDENNARIPNNIAVTTNEFFFIDGLGNGADIHNVFDATSIRLREVSLGYSLPKSILENIFIGSAYISLTGRNLWFSAPNFPEGMNIDPEVSSLNSNATGLDFSTIPTVKRFGMNMRLTF